MTFKDVVKKDIQNVFMNFTEFGELHKLNGKECLVIIDENELTEREKKIKNSGETNGVKGRLYKKQLLFYIPAERFGPLPEPGKQLNFDGKEYIITDANNESGIYSVSLEALRS